MNDSELILQKARDAGRLLARAVQTRLTPSMDLAYGELLAKYASDPDLREITSALAEGLGLRIATDSGVHGLIVVATEDGPFVSKMRDFQEGMSQRDRITYGLLCMLLAAYVFPSVDALDAPLEEAPTRIELPVVVATIRRMCEQAVQTAPAPAAEGERPLIGAEHLLALREVSQTGDRSTLTAMFRKVCEHHTDSGLFQSETANITAAKGVEVPAVYRPRPHYRIHVQNVARGGHRALLAFFQSLVPAR
ncbi:MAG: hypothetical protein ACOZE5_17200 [Verrucomicrobiota bacterium]